MSQSNGPIPLQQQVNDITNVPVTTARTNMNTEYKAIEDRLAKLPLPSHGAILQMLGAAYQVREDAMKNAISEHQAAIAWRRQQEEEKARKDLEAEQERIAAANKPQLAPVGVQ